jgi:ABC-type uncharacterized transport system permease subunit
VSVAGGPASSSPVQLPDLAEFRSTGASRTRRSLVVAVVAFLLLVVVREITHSSELTSSGTFSTALRTAVPILLAGLGALYAERVGVVNIGLEGMMILGTWFGAWAGWKFGIGWGVVGGVLGGGMGGLLHAIATVTFGVNQIISGVAINTLGLGIARFLSVVAYSPSTGGGATQSPQVQGTIPHASVPILAGGKIFGWQSPDFFLWMERRHWFLFSDVGALFQGLTHDLSWLTILSLALIPLTFWVLWRTAIGLRLRSVGENPTAAETLGVPVYTMRYIGVIISGMLAGLGGAYLSIDASSIYREGQTAGRGFIGLAALIFGNYRPSGVGAAAGIFGYPSALVFRSDPAVHALLLFVAVALALATLRAVIRRKSTSALVSALLSAAFFWWYAASDTVPRTIISITPHITTLLVLALASQRLRPPAADGLPYRKGQAQ